MIVRCALQILAVFLAWQMVPGSAEIVENAVHLIVHGDTAHGSADADHGEGDPEHGCSGSVHLCSCHASVNLAVSAVAQAAFVEACRDTKTVWLTDGTPARAHLAALFRPPIA